MLLDETAEKRIKGIMDAIGGAVATYLIGRDLGTARTQSWAGAFGRRNTTSLEQSYLAGRIAAIIGSDLKDMSAADLENWLRNNSFQLSQAELAQLKALQDDTERWVQGRTDVWKQAFHVVLARQNSMWRAELARTAVGDARTHAETRNAALREVSDALRGTTASFNNDVSRLLQTESHKYFQQGQASAWDPDETVYKIPRAGACPSCMRLHLNADGSPRLYKLRDVAGNTNVGAKQVEWEFTIGPTHPWCYCVLQSVGGNEPPGPDEERADQRSTALKKALPTPGDTETLVQLRKHLGHDHELEPHLRTLMEQVRLLYDEGAHTPTC